MKKDKKILTAEKIIKEGLEVALEEYPETFIEKLFHKRPSELKLKSGTITYLTDRILKSDEAYRMIDKKMQEMFYDALRIMGERSPEDAHNFHNKYEKR